MPERPKPSVTEQPLPFSYDDEATEEGVTALRGRANLEQMATVGARRHSK